MRRITLGLAVFALVATVLATAGCQPNDGPRGDRIRVVASLFPSYDFARQVGGHRVDVTLLLPPGVEAHAFEPSPRDVMAIHNADVFLYTGRHMEPWAERVLYGVDADRVTVVDLSTAIGARTHACGEFCTHGHVHAPAHDHADGDEDEDPHIWLDLGLAQQMVDAIAECLAERDPDGADFYRENARAYNAKLNDLDERFRHTAARGRHDTIIYAGHFAFGRFAKRYDLKHMSPYAGFSPDAEPSPRAVGEVIQAVRQTGVRYIFHEELLEPRLARTIGEETGTQLLLLHGLHNLSRGERERGETFLSLMEFNRAQLQKGLESPP